MLITEKADTINTTGVGGVSIDKLQMHWYETNKRILHKVTNGGQKISLKFLQENPEWKENEVVYADSKTIITIEIIPCDAIVITPATIMQAAAISYEIGNKHLPLFTDNNELIIPYDAPLFRLLQASGYSITREQRKLQHPLKTSVAPHGAAANSDSLFSKILKLTTST